MADLPPANRPARSTSNAPSLHDSTQCKALARTLASAERTIRSVLASPDLLLALAPVGYNELELNKGLTLVTTSQAKFAARQEALAVSKLATKALAMAIDIAKKEFAAYRTAVLAHGLDASAAERGFSEPIPNDGAKFCVIARNSYTRGLTEPHAGVLSKCGFPPERLTKALNVLDKLDTAESTHASAVSTVSMATEARDVAADALTTWINKLRATASVPLKSRPAFPDLLMD